MIVLPTEKRFDWRYPPIMLFSIVLLNILVFFLYQTNDEHKFEQAINHYQNSGLLRMEWPAYQNYLELEGETEELKLYRQQYEEKYYHQIVYSAAWDKIFYDYLLEHADQLKVDLYDENDNWHNWSDQRKELATYFDSISYIRFGLIPAELYPVTFITHQFMHGDFMHLLGNMFFLVLCGFAVEASIGPALFLALYLISGVIGGLTFSVFNLTGTEPLVGASGAISGVMAIYLGIFKLKKIEFFYWFFVFAGYFRAPALLLLPFYLGKELLDYFLNTDSNVAFLAHAGGFVSGALSMLALHYFKPEKINNEYIEEDQTIDPARQERAIFFQLIERMQFNAAKKQAEKIKANGAMDLSVALLRYNILRSKNDTDVSGAFVDMMNIAPKDDHELDKLAQMWSENEDLHDQIPLVKSLKLAMIFATQQHVVLAEGIFEKCFQDHRQLSAVNILARKLSIIFGKNNQIKKKKHYAHLADALLEGSL
jgi:membrane associated rhomboid family serine protease